MLPINPLTSRRSSMTAVSCYNPVKIQQLVKRRSVMTLSENCQRTLAVNSARISLIICVLVTADSGGPLTAADDWPNWRGPQANGQWDAPPLQETWPEKLPTVWEAKVGPGYSGVAVAGGRVYTLDRQADNERVVCLDAGDGRSRWSSAYLADYGDLDYGKGPRSTPTIHRGRVYTVGAVGHVRCLKASTGETIWAKDLVGDLKARQPTWGFAASPVIYRDTVILHVGGEPNGCYVAFDCETGQERWRVGADPAGYCTPILARDGSRELLLGWTPEHVMVINPQDGDLIAQLPYKVTMGVSIATPIYRQNTLLVTGYWEGAKAITVAGDDLQLAWEENRQLRGLMAQPLYRDGHVYVLDKQHGIVCARLETGEVVWTDDNRLTPRSRNPQATLVWVGKSDRAICLNSTGELVLCRFTPGGYTELARAKVCDETWAHPAYSGNRVYLRDDSRLTCIELPKTTP